MQPVKPLDLYIGILIISSSHKSSNSNKEGVQSMYLPLRKEKKKKKTGMINSFMTHSTDFYKKMSSQVNALMAILHENPYVSACMINHFPAMCMCIHSLALHT
jgi:hypothetical protein